MEHPSRRELEPGREHLTTQGKFQSDKYKWCPDGYVPIKVTDPIARELLAAYAVRRQHIDPAFCRDLLEALGSSSPQASKEKADGEG